MEITETFEEGCSARGTYCGNYSEMSWTNQEEGVPCIIWVECGEEQPRENHPRIKFATDKNVRIWGQAPELGMIPMMICDEPYIPDSYKHIKHNLTEEDLDKLKNWVVKNKELLFELGEGKTDIISFYEQCWRG